jgi:hypothetical protein
MLYFPMCYNDFQKDILIFLKKSFLIQPLLPKKNYIQIMLKINTKYANITN